MSGAFRDARQRTADALGGLEVRVIGSYPETVDPPVIVVGRLSVGPGGSMGRGYTFTVPVLVVGGRADTEDATDHLDLLADDAWAALLAAGFRVDVADPTTVDGNGQSFPAYTLQATLIGACT